MKSKTMKSKIFPAEDKIKKRVTVAQIGVGYWGPNLLRNLIANDRCDVKIVADISEKRLNFVKKMYPSVHLTSNSNFIFEDPEIEAVVIATPVAMHFDLSRKALEAGKHILVEKPMATTISEMQEIIDLAKQNSLVSMVGHTFLYNSAVRYLKGIIDSGELGDIRYIYSQRLNLGRIRSDVDALWNFAPHDISIIQYLLDNLTPISVKSHGMDYIQDGIDDVVFIDAVYPKKIMAHIHVSWLDPRRMRQLTVVGSNKMVIYDDIAENKIAVFDKGIDRIAILGENMDYDNNGFSRFVNRIGDVYLPKVDLKEPLKVEIEHFIECVQNGTQCITGSEHALKVVEIMSSASGNNGSH